MLFWVGSNEPVEEIGKTRKTFFSTAKARLSNDEYEAIREYINEIIDRIVDEGERYFVPGQNIPSDWSGTPIQVVYDKACQQDSELSALWLGLISMQVVIDRPEKWYATKIELNGRAFEQMIYFISES